MRRRVLLVGFLLIAAAPAIGDDDPIRQARQLILEDRIEEAAIALESVRDSEGDEAQLLWGLVELSRERYAAAADRFESVLTVRPDRTAVWLYLAQARFATGDLAGAQEALRAGESVGRDLAGYYVLRARTEEGLGLQSEAWTTLEAGRAQHPDDLEIHRERTLHRIRLGLHGAAGASAREYLARAEHDPFAWLVAGSALREAGQSEEAVLILEEARLRFPGETELTAQLAHAYARQGHHRSAAGLFEQLSLGGVAFAFEAADQFRLAGQARAALRWNARVADPERKLPQRVAILVAAERYDLALTLQAPLDAHGLLDDAMAYHLAYAAVATDRYDLATTLTDSITDDGYASLVTSLRRTIDACEKDPARCR